MGRLRKFSEVNSGHCDWVATMSARCRRRRRQCQQHLTLLTLGRDLAGEPNGGLQATTVSSQVDRDRQQPLQSGRLTRGKPSRFGVHLSPRMLPQYLAAPV